MSKRGTKFVALNYIKKKSQEAEPQSQVVVVLLGDNNLRKGKQSPKDLKPLLENLLGPRKR